PFTPNDYTDIKNYIENARNEGKSYKEEYTGIIRESSEDLGRWETDSGNSDAGIGSVSVPSMGKRTPDRTDNERESKPVKSRGDENPETGTESGTNKLTQLQQKYVDEQKTAYNKKITDDKKALDSAISERNKNVKEFYKANSPFRGETEQRNMFSDEEMTNISNENAKRINEKYQSAVDNAREEYNRLVNDRPSVIERFAKEAQSQTEIATEKSPQEKLDDVGGDLIAHAKRESKSAEIKSEEERVDTNPTDAQKEAGNYQKGHVKVQGFDVSIENPKGSTRSGTDENGEAWNQEMKNSYGYIRRTTGMDGDHIDVFLGNNPASKKVFVVDQNRPSDGKFDEHKVMLGFNSIDEARDAYLSNYEDGWKGLGNITETTVDDFSKWVDKDGARTKPFSDYKDNQKETPDNMRFQTASEKLQESQNDFTPITKEQTDALIEPLKAKGLAKDLIYDETEYDKAFDKAKEKLKYKDGTTYGFVTDDKVVYLDPRKLNANTPIHEFGHLYWNVMPSEMKAKITELLKQTPKWKELEDNPAYSYLETDDQKADEIFNTLLGNEGEKSQKVQEIIGNDVKLTDKIKSTIGDVWEWVKANIFQKTDAKINQFTKKTLGELLNGKPVYEEGGSVLDFNRRMIDWKKNNLDESNSSLDGLEIIDTPKHNFKNISEARKWAKENIAGTYHNTNTSEDIDVSKTVIDKYLSQSAVGKSANLDVHLSTLKQLPKLIETSVLLETSQDRDNKPKIKEIQRLYGAINLEGDNYPVKITVKAYSHGKNNAYSYEVMNIETPEKGAGTPTGMNKNSNYAALPDVDVNKSHDKDTNISETNKNNENNARFQIILTNPTEDTPKHEPGEHPLDYAKRVTRWLREQAKQKELSEGQPANDGGKNMVGISHEALNDLAKRTGLPPIERGIGYNLKELANRGRKLLAAGADPKQIEDDFYNKKLLDGNMISVIRAKIEDLKKNIDSISDKSSKAFKDNFDEWNHYIQVVKHMGTKAGNDFGSLRGQRDLDTDTFSYIALATQNKTGKSLTEIQKNKIEELTKENSDLKQQISDHEKKLIEALDKEHSKIVSTEKAPTTQTPQKKNIVAQGKSLADRIRKAKIHRPDSFMVATPASLAWDGGVEVVARTAETGARLADAIQQGVSYIRNTDWYKNLSDSKKEKAEDDFVNWNNDQSGLTDLQSQFVDKHDNKFTREEAKGIWNYMKQNYISNGTPYADAVSYVANDLGLTMEQVNNAIITPKTKPLADAVWKANRDLSRNRAVTQRWVDEQSHSEAYKKFKKATELFREAAVFGHGGIFVGTHAMPTLFDLPHAKHTVKAMIDAYKFAYGNEANYELMMRDLENSQNYVIAQRAGLQNDPRRFGSDSEITSNWFKKWSTAGERGFNAIKVLRQKLFDIEYEKLSAAEREDSDSVKAIAQIINNATGATNMKMSGWVNDVTFAGGMEASRWERIVKNPAKALGILSKWNRATTAEKVFAKVWTRRAAITAGTYMLGLTINNALNYYFYGDDKHKVNFFNPLKSDWMQYKVGDVTLNPTSGVLSTLRFAVGLASLPFVNSGTIKNEYHADNRLDAFGKDVLKYGEGKLSPFYSTVLENITHHDYSGNTLPFYDDKPLYGFNHKMSYTEYLLSKAPLPIAEASQLYNESIRNQGVPEDKVHAFWKAIEHGVISGTTGARLYDNTKQEGEKYNSLIDYYKKGTEQKLSDIDNDVSTVVSKGKDYSKEYFDAHKHEILEGKDPLKYNDDMQKYINEKLNVDFKKNNDIDLKIKTINKMEKSLPNLKGKEKNDMEERLSKYKDGVIRLHDAMKAKDDSEFDKILKELNK
ncbi:MAG: hypothetical protein FWD60_04755, partial [Candidatus Azobacteroides sp.]|nr:hypothetical protein [Candidatus Azobacteroides sp.]